MHFRALWVLSLVFLIGCATKSHDISSSDSWPCYKLNAEQTWQLDSPNHERFDASGLLLQKGGRLLTVNDRGSELYEIKISSGKVSANLVLLTNCFTEMQLAGFAKEKLGR